ncbi:MAG: glycosyltransferase family 4 protein [Alphaproteobacteria bacterium]|nr:glycosyltransferase family 4 protein [Alphaproteobacteria bacterium]
MKTAIVHEWLVEWAGSERVVAALVDLFPNADVWALFDHLPPADRRALSRPVKTSWVQHLPQVYHYLPLLLPFLPSTVENYDLRAYDLIISSHHALAHGVITAPHQRHIVYSHSPMRAAWDLQHEYLATLPAFLRPAGAHMLHHLRQWDALAGQRADEFVANSHYVAARIQKFYRRTARVIHPPVDLTNMSPATDKDDYYITAGRLVPYKQHARVIEAFKRLPHLRLVVAGDGPMRAPLEELAAGAKNISILGALDRPSLIHHLRLARGFIQAAVEDFGILSVEALGCGTPVLAYAHGGAADVVTSPAVGRLLTDRSPQALAEAVDAFNDDRHTVSAEACRSRAEAFSPAVFQQQWLALVTQP